MSCILNSNIDNRCKGIIYSGIAESAVYSVNITENADYFMIACANASTEKTSPVIQIIVDNVGMRQNNGAIGGSVATYWSATLHEGDVVKFVFQNVVTDARFNSYFVMRMKLNN